MHATKYIRTDYNFNTNFLRKTVFQPSTRTANVRIQAEMAIRRINGWHVFDGVTPLRLCGVVNQPWIVSYLLVNWQKNVI